VLFIRRFLLFFIQFFRPLKLVFMQYPFIYPRGIIHSIESYLKKLNKKTEWYHLRGGIWFEKRYESEMQKNLLPQNFDDNDVSKFRQNRVVKTHESFLVRLNKVFVFGDSGIVFTEKNEIFSQLVHNFDISPLKKSYIFKPFYSFSFSIEKNNKMAALLCSPQCTNYYHWLFDVVPRIALLDDCLDAIEFFIVPASITTTQVNMLAALGIEQERLYKIEPNKKVWFQNLYIPSLPGSEGLVPKWSINFIRNSFIKNTTTNVKKNIYFTRKDVANRKIINEDKVIELLKKNGFEIITMSTLSFLEQVDICAQAATIISYHGAALSNIVFASNCKIVEIFSPDYFRTDCYYTLANQLGFKYWYIVGENKTIGENKLGWGDITIEIKQLEQTLLKVLEN